MNDPPRVPTFVGEPSVGARTARLKEDDVLSDRPVATVVAHPATHPIVGMSVASQGSESPVDGVEALLTRILSSLEEDRAEDVVAIDLRGRSEMADHMVIASGRSTRQVAAISEHLTERLKEAGTASKTEGAEHGDWVLIDAGDVIVHVFRPEVREFYQLEKMWTPTSSAAGGDASA